MALLRRKVDRKVWPYGKGRAVLDGYMDIYNHRLESVADRLIDLI